MPDRALDGINAGTVISFGLNSEQIIHQREQQDRDRRKKGWKRKTVEQVRSQNRAGHKKENDIGP